METGVMVTIVMATVMVNSCHGDLFSPSDECEEEGALCAHILDCGAPCADLTPQNIVEDLSNVLLCLGTDKGIEVDNGV